MNHKKRKDVVVEAIFNNAFIGFNDLCKLLQADPKTSMSKITIHKIVNELVDEDSVRKIKEEGKQNVKLCAFTEEIDIATTNYKEVEDKLDEFENYFKTLEKLAKEISHVNFARLVYRFVNSIWYLDWKTKSNFIPIKSEEKRILKRIDSLKTKLFDFSYRHEEIFLTITTLVSNELTSNMLDAEVSFTDELEEYEDYE